MPAGQLASEVQPPGQLTLAPSQRAPPEHPGEPAVPAFAGPHVPSSVPDCLSAPVHASHAPPHVTSQQTPSVQLPDAHSAQAPVVLQSTARLHAAPCAFCVEQVPAEVQ